ncbi:hypothetical protein RAS1_19900 [Phycisphaerae bacterium RAS1]|nr:hypothetical protein RAS1_19900 [Phycisphaerae bacterium RAS1]
MKWTLTHALGLLSGLALSTGCSTGDASTGARFGLNLAKKDSHLKIWLDEEQAKQNKVKKAATGYSRWDVKHCSTTPKLRFEIEDPDRFGRIGSVMLSIYQKFEAQYSDRAEFTLVARDKDPQAQMKPGIVYDLAQPGQGFRVFDINGNDVTGVKLIPGVKYMMTLTVAADKSETAQVFFETTHETPTAAASD